MTTQDVETSIKEIWALFKETDARLDQRFKETDARLDQRFKETDASLKITDTILTQKFQETDKKIKSLAELFTGQWGKLIESLAESGILELLHARGINVTTLARRLSSQKNGYHMELDFLLSNETELVIGEVKTTMGVADVNNFREKLASFLTFFPYFKYFKIYGAMIGVRIEGEADKYAYRNGLFVLKVGGQGMLKMLNDVKFIPRDFNLAAPSVE